MYMFKWLTQRAKLFSSTDTVTCVMCLGIAYLCFSNIINYYLYFTLRFFLSRRHTQLLITIILPNELNIWTKKYMLEFIVIIENNQTFYVLLNNFN